MYLLSLGLIPLEGLAREWRRYVVSMLALLTAAGCLGSLASWIMERDRTREEAGLVMRRENSNIDFLEGPETHSPGYAHYAG